MSLVARTAYEDVGELAGRKAGQLRLLLIPEIKGGAFIHRRLLHPTPAEHFTSDHDGRNSFKIPTLKICSTARLNVIVLFRATSYWSRRIVMALSGGNRNGFRVGAPHSLVHLYLC